MSDAKAAEQKFHVEFLAWLATHMTSMPLQRSMSKKQNKVSITNGFFLVNEVVLAAALRLADGKIMRAGLCFNTAVMLRAGFAI